MIASNVVPLARRAGGECPGLSAEWGTYARGDNVLQSDGGLLVNL